MVGVVFCMIAFLVGMALASYISGYVAYEDGIEDERRKWYIHAHCHGHKESEYNKDK